ncbi:hypothetical protein T492DRAFT_1095728 [Pavlovales sp. CCMP2436]|nr:hypothetical protein T492DRAFT_1095728 [Pavlovales sp. CCMP2436]
MRPLHRRRRRAGRRTATDEDGYLRIRLAGCDEDKQTVASARPVDAPSPPRSLARGRRASCTPCQRRGACRRCRTPWPPRVCPRVSSRSATASACAPWPPTWRRQTPGGSRATAPRPRE